MKPDPWRPWITQTTLSRMRKKSLRERRRRMTRWRRKNLELPNGVAWMAACKSNIAARIWPSMLLITTQRFQGSNWSINSVPTQNSRIPSPHLWVQNSHRLPTVEMWSTRNSNPPALASIPPHSPFRQAVGGLPPSPPTASSVLRRVTLSSSTWTPPHPSNSSTENLHDQNAPVVASLPLTTIPHPLCITWNVQGDKAPRELACTHRKEECAHLCSFCSKQDHHALSWECCQQSGHWRFYSCCTLFFSSICRFLPFCYSALTFSLFTSCSFCNFWPSFSSL